MKVNMPLNKETKLNHDLSVFHCWRLKDNLISDILRWTPMHGLTSVGQPAKTYIHQLWMDIEHLLEDLPRTMADRDNWCKRDKEDNLCCQHAWMMIKIIFGINIFCSIINCVTNTA